TDKTAETRILAALTRQGRFVTVGARGSQVDVPQISAGTRTLQPGMAFVGATLLAHPDDAEQGIASVIFQADHIAGAEGHADAFYLGALVAQIFRADDFQKGVALGVRAP